jgi:NADPH-dependent curcumin reductase CurA
MFDVGRLKDGDTVLISGAAGSVGLVNPLSIPSPSLHPSSLEASTFRRLTTQIACQIALAHPKCKVIALASSSKIKQLEKLGCHSVLDYTKPGFKKELRKEGLIDVYFDNGTFFSVFHLVGLTI